MALAKVWFNATQRGPESHALNTQTNSAKLRLWLLVCFALVFVAALAGAPRLSVIEDAAEAMLPTDPESVARYAQYLERYPNDQGALIVFQNLLCTEAGWDLIKRTERAFRDHPIIERTIGLASPSARYVVGSGDEIDLSRFADVDFDTPQQRCEAAASYRPFSQLLVSADKQASAMFLITERDLSATASSEALLSTFAPFKAEADALGGRMIITGEAIMSAELSAVVGRDSAYVGGVLVIMLILVVLVTRSLATTGVALVLTLFVLACSYGFMGWAGIPLSPATSLVVFLLVPLSSAFVIHAHGYVTRQEEDAVIPLEARMPCVLAGVSTAVGFACTGLTPAPDIQSLALMGVVGIAAGTLGLFLFAFPVLTRLRNLRFAITFAVPRWPMVHPRFSFLILLMLGLATVVGLSRLKVDYGPSDYLPLSNPARAQFEEAGQWFGRMNLPLVVYSDEVESPEIWEQLRPLIQQLYATYPQGFQASWLYDHVSELSLAFSDDELSFPQDAETLAQLLLWFDPEDLELYIDDERESLLILFQLPYIGSSDYFEMKAQVADYLDSKQLDGHFIGRVSSFFETGHRIGADNLKGLAIAAGLIFLLLLVLFRSMPMALIGVFINALPVLVSLAVLGLLGVSIDLGSSIVAAMAFGIVLDDSTHLLVRLRQLQQSGYDPATAVLRAISQLIAPIMITTFVVCAGFTVLYASEPVMFHDFATLIMTTMFVALLADVVILPGLVRQFLRDPLSAPVAAHSG